MRTAAFFAVFISVLLAWNLQAFSQGRKLSESSLRVADCDRRIEEQRSKNKVLSGQCEKILSDSAAAVLQAGRRIDSLERIIGDLGGQADRGKKSLSVLQEQLSGLEAETAKKDAERAAVSLRSHQAIGVFGPAITACKDSLAAAKSELDLARSDSIDLHKRITEERTRLADSLSAMEKSLAGFQRKIDSLSVAKIAVRQDSLSTRKTNDDSLAAVQKRLADLRRFVASKDSAVTSATEGMNSSTKDSMSAQVENQKDAQAREKKVKTLDSLVSAMQSTKTNLFRMREKLQLDSSVQVLTGQLGDFLNKSYEVRQAATGPEAEKAQMLDNYRGKLDNLMRDESFAALVATAPGKTWHEQNEWVSGRLAAIQATMDSTSAAREKSVRDGVLLGKEFQQAMKNFAIENKRLNDLIAKTWKELINTKPRIARMEQDSAAAAKRRESTSEAHGKKQVALAAESAAASAGKDSLTRRRDELKTFMTGKEAAYQKELSNASAAIVSAVKGMRHSQTALDNVAAGRQAARDDSVRVDKEMSVFVSLSRQAVDAKKEEIKLKSDAISLIAARQTKTRTDSTAAARDKREQENVFRQLLAEQRRMMQKGEQAIADMQDERKRAAAPRPAAPQPAAPQPAQETARPSQKQSQSEKTANLQLTKIYELLDQGKNAAAKKTFTANRKLLEKYLFPDAFQTIKTTLESLEPEQPKAPVPAAAPARPAASPPAAPVVVPTPPPAVPEPEAERLPATIFISSVPPVASVYMDGQMVGKTNVGFVKVTSGKHTMQFIKGGLTCTMEMTFAEGQNPAAVVKLPCGQ